MDDRQEIAVAMLERQPFGSFDAQRERRDIRDDHIIDTGRLADQSRLHGGPERYHLIGVQSAMRRAAKQFGSTALDDLRHPRRTAHENHFVQIGAVQPSVSQSAANRQFQPSDNRLRKPVELFAG